MVDTSPFPDCGYAWMMSDAAAAAKTPGVHLDEDHHDFLVRVVVVNESGEEALGTVFVHETKVGFLL